MKITKRQLRRVIQEEYRNILNENTWKVAGTDAIESPDGSYMSIPDASSDYVIQAGNRDDEVRIKKDQDGSIYMMANKYDKSFPSVEELVEFLQGNNFEYYGIDDSY